MHYRRSSPPQTLKACGFVALILGAALACYWPALGGEFLWDDPAHVTKPDLQSVEGLGRIWFEFGATQEYYPVLHSAFWLQHRLWGDAPQPYHLTNILLHAANCCLLAFLLRRLWTPATTGSGAAAANRVVPPGTEWLAALLFAVHPVCVESVAWITEQKNTLSTAFYLLAALCYFDFSERRKPWTYGVALGLFALALGAKTMTVTLPAALLVLLWWQQGKLAWKRDVVPLLPWFFVAIAAGLLTAWHESSWVGAGGPEWEMSGLHRSLLASRVLWFSLSSVLWPVNLSFFYERWDVASEAAGWGLFVAATVITTAGLMWYRHRSRGPLAAWLLYAGTLFPVLGFFNVFGFSFSYVADHFQYLAIPVVIAAVAAGLTLGFQRIPAIPRWGGPVLAAGLLAWLGARSFQQSRLYQNDETLFRATLARVPDSWMAHHILAVALSRSTGREREAQQHFEAAMRLNPNFPDAYFGLGVVLSKTPERRADALAFYRRALELRPHYAEAHNNLGFELAKEPDRVAEAIDHFEAAVRVRPRMAEAHINLANALAKLPEGRTQLPAAVAHYEEALRIRPDSLDALNGLGIALARLGRLEEARTCWENAVRLHPGADSARKNLELLERMTNP